MKSIILSLLILSSTGSWAATISDGVYECQSGSVIDETDEDEQTGDYSSTSFSFKIEINPDHLVFYDKDTGAVGDVLIFSTKPITSETDDEFGKEINVSTNQRDVDRIFITTNNKVFDENGMLTSEDKVLTVLTGLANNRIYAVSNSEYTEIDGKSSSTENSELIFYCKLVN